MAREKLSRNAPCPCGIGKKYKVCCLKKGIEYAEDASGTIHQSVPVTDEVAGVFRVQREKFVERFGRESGPDDRRRILTCGIPDGRVRVEWLPPAAPGVDSRAEMRLYGLVRIGDRGRAIRFVRDTRHVSRPEAVKLVQKIASDLGLCGDRRRP